MSKDFDIEDVLRASLAEHARKAPDANQLAERIIADADHPQWVHEPRGSRHWRGWMLPAVAAASVVAVVGTIIGLVQLKQSDKHDADNRPLNPDRASSSVATSTGSTQIYGDQAAPTTAPSVGQVGGDVPKQFKVIDLTFVSEDYGWALGRGKCLDGTPGTCQAILQTADGGANWKSTPTPDGVDVQSACGNASCVSNLRFANDKVGYAYGPDSLYTTTDGGLTWDPNDQGPTSSLEVANGVALRVAGDQLLSADVGSTTWTRAPLPATATVTGPVVRALSHAYVSAAAGDQIYASGDDGSDWSAKNSPCPAASQITGMTAGADGSLVVTCLPRAKVAAPQVYVSDAKGGAFRALAGLSVDGLDQPFGATNSSTVFRTVDGRLERTTDGGGHWTPVATDSSKGSAGFLGFESPTTGRWVTGDGSTIWTTTDGGQNWRGSHFK